MERDFKHPFDYQRPVLLPLRPEGVFIRIYSAIYEICGSVARGVNCLQQAVQ